MEVARASLRTRVSIGMGRLNGTSYDVVDGIGPQETGAVFSSFSS